MATEAQCDAGDLVVQKERGKKNNCRPFLWVSQRGQYGLQKQLKCVNKSRTLHKWFVICKQNVSWRKK